MTMRQRYNRCIIAVVFGLILILVGWVLSLWPIVLIGSLLMMISTWKSEKIDVYPEKFETWLYLRLFEEDPDIYYKVRKEMRDEDQL